MATSGPAEISTTLTDVTMAFRADSIRPAFEAQGNEAFTVWAYSSGDRLGQVLSPGYFASASRAFRPGDLIYVGLASPPRGQPIDSKQRLLRRALLMVSTVGGEPSVTTRLVQDIGGPLDESAPMLE